MKIIDALLAKFGLVRVSHVKHQLDFGYSVAKRLDEHREVVEAIAKETDLFNKGYWHAMHLAAQDDYLMRVFRLVHGVWPNSTSTQSTSELFVRPRPAVLDLCKLPEIISQE